MTKVQRLTLDQACDLADQRDSRWYYDFCERDGSVQELAEFLGVVIEEDVK